MKSMLHIPSRSRHQHGMTLPMTALFIVVLFAFAALAVDLGMLYTARTSAQHAADAAALAGAYTFVNAPFATDAEKITNATEAALAVGTGYRILGRPVPLSAGDVQVDTANQRVTVILPLTGTNAVHTYFARVIGWNSVNVSTRATAEAGTQGAASHCLKPIFIPNTILAPASDGNGTAGIQNACNNGHVIFNSSTHQLSDWFVNTRFPQLQQQYGQPVTASPMNIRPSNPVNALVPSQFYSLDFGSGANTYRCALGKCLNECPNVSTNSVSCGYSYSLKTGDMVGPTRQGISDLIGSPEDTFGGIRNGQYIFYEQGNSATPSANSQSVAVAPVWDNCSQSVSPGYHGQNVQVAGFANIFFKGMQGQDVQAYFLGATPCAAAGSPGAAPPSSGPLGVPVRLVQNAN